jgi:uncharacterized protein YbbC (DUF1343 family)
VGLLTHANVMDEEGMPVYERLLQSSRVQIKTLFGPQHGFFLQVQQAQMVPTESSQHPTLGIPIYSLYRKESRDVNPEWLKNLDWVLVDLPDVGVKVYTYLWSMTKMMQACSKAKIKVVVLDRPNPISAMGVMGPITQAKFTSFVGLYPVAFCHGMTLGEMAMYLNHHFKIGCELKVIPMQGWKRGMSWEDTGLSWVPPSPNLRTVEAACHYPMTVMVEATEVSEGRGTDAPFCQVGAPYFNSRAIITRIQKLLQPMNQKACKMEPVTFTPDHDKFKGQKCQGIKFFVQNEKTYHPFDLGLAALKAIHDLHPEFKFRSPPYEYEFSKNPFDITLGTDLFRTHIQDDHVLDLMKQACAKDLKTFESSRRPFLLYEG